MNSNTLLVEIFSKPGCHLCDEAKEVLFKAKQEFGLEIKEVNIEEDDELFKRYRYDIPVIWINSRKAFKHRIDDGQLRERLESEKRLPRK